MATTGVTSSTAAQSSTNTNSVTRNVGGELGINEFLKILTVQLTNQDPLEPMKDTDFIAQMAQFSALQQMTALNETFASSQAYNLVGKDVAASVKVNGINTQIYGKVSGVVRQSGKNYLQVGDFLVTPDQVEAVYNDTEVDNTIAQAANLIDKKIIAELPAPTEKDPSNTTTFEGTVEYVLVKNGALYVKCKDTDTEVPVAYIKQIG